MQCPSCETDSDFVYIGLNDVYCINPRCRHYDDATRAEYEKSQEHPKAPEQLEYDFSDLTSDEEDKADDADTWPGWAFPSSINHKP